MRYLVTFTLLFTLSCISTSEGLSLRNKENHVFKRAVKSALTTNVKDFIPVLEGLLISNCGKNGQNLTEVYDELKLCVGKKNIGVVPKEEYLLIIEQCSQDAVAKTKDCLADYQKYFPDFLLTLTKSLVSVIYYDDKYIVQGELALCAPKITRDEAAIRYETCVSNIAKRDNDTRIIAPKPEFCKTFIDISYCFVDLIEEECGHSTDLDKFRDDYMDASKSPCI